MMEIAITGEGELVIRYIEKSGQTLLEERINVSGSPRLEARRIVELSLMTTNGRAQLAPVLMRQSNQEQAITFDGEAPARFTRARCKAIGCDARTVRDASSGKAPHPTQGQGPAGGRDDRSFARLLKSVSRQAARR